MIHIKKVAIFAAFITIIPFGTTNAKGDGENKNHNRDRDCNRLELCYMEVCVTKYHKSEPHCDPGTLNGDSKTGVKLREGNSKVIGTIATDPRVIPFGSLVLMTTKKGVTNLYLAVDIGGAVTARRASRQLAKQDGLGKEWATRPVIDVYSSREIISNWSTVMIVKAAPLGKLKDSELRPRLKERMYTGYWMSRGLELPDKKQFMAYNK